MIRAAAPRRFLFLLAALVAFGVLSAASAPTASAANPWSASGPGTATVVSDGTSAPPQFSYALHVSCCASGSWTFSTTAGSSGSVELPWQYSGFHAFFQVKVNLSAFVTHNGSTTTTSLVNGGPVNCCSPPSGGFSYSGTTTLSVQAGDTYGFTMGGSNGDSNGTLNGTLSILRSAPDLSTETNGSVDLGGTITDTAALDGTAPGAGGTLTFNTYSDSACATSPVHTHVVSVNGDGHYDDPGFVPTASGIYYWTVTYSGDGATFTPGATSACGSPAGSSAVTRTFDVKSGDGVSPPASGTVQDLYVEVSTDDGTTWTPAWAADYRNFWNPWPPLDGSQWLVPTSSLGQSFGDPQTIRYRISFSLPSGFQAPFLDGQLRPDDEPVSVSLNGTEIASWQSTGTFDASPRDFSSDDAGLFQTGANTLELAVRNLGGVTGIDFAATVHYAGDAPPAPDPLQAGPTYTVSSTGDSAAACRAGSCTLRAAIAAANANAGADRIQFSLGQGATISPTSALPSLTDPVTIDGGGSCGSPGVVLDGSGAGSSTDGLVLATADSSTVTGLAVRRFGGDGIVVGSTGNTVRCNTLGGGDGEGNGGSGIVLDEGTVDNTVGSNTISHNGAAGVEIAAGSEQNVVEGNTIEENGGAGVLVDGSSSNTIGSDADGQDDSSEGNTISDNGGAGVAIGDGSGGDRVSLNAITGNTGLAIDLGDDGRTENSLDAPGRDAPNDGQNFPVLRQAVPTDGGLKVLGRLDVPPPEDTGEEVRIEFYSAESCTSAGLADAATFLGATEVTPDADGGADIDGTLAVAPAAGTFVTATATSSVGSTSELGPCVSVGPDNDSWPHALTLSGASSSTDGFLDSEGQSRWYRFAVQPGAEVQVSLSNLPADYDLTLFSDIGQAFDDLNGPQDLLRLGAESAGDAFSPSAFSPSAFSPSAFSPSAFSPSAFSPSAFSPSAFSPSAFSPSAFSPSAFSPSAFSPSAFSPSAFSPSAFSPSAFSPSAFSPLAFSPSAFSPSAFSGAQTRSLVAVSALDGTTPESIVANTWNSTGYFYVRVRGRNGAYDPGTAFRLDVSLDAGSCTNVVQAPQSAPAAIPNSFETIVVADPAATPGTGGRTALRTTLDEFAARPEVDGKVVDIGDSARIQFLRTQADANPACVYAKNLEADAIKDVIDAYRAGNDSGTLKYVVLAGDDRVIPFFRYPDTALLGPESAYSPPVADNTPSQASLRLGYVLSQDAYGSTVDVALHSNEFPLPDLAVGRLVESTTEITGMLNAYLGLQDGVVPTPTSALVTGYDFLADTADSVAKDFRDGKVTDVDDSLVTERTVSPDDPRSWSASDLKAKLATRHDLVFLAGHFSANSALAADYKTQMLTTELPDGDVLQNSIVFSAGCHSGYNIVDGDGIPGLTQTLDWPQAFAQKQATLIAGTGYQYGDTDFLEYSERIYAGFARQLRIGSGPVSVGDALMQAKKAYLAATPVIRGLHEKALLEATLFGLPMLSVDLPEAGRLPATPDESAIDELTRYPATPQSPGSVLDLRYADLNVTSSAADDPVNVTMHDFDTNTDFTATYFRGADGVVTNAAEPALPLEVKNVTPPAADDGYVLRGVLFLGGDYTQRSVIPLTGAPATEIRGVHAAFQSDVFWPLRPWNVNYLDALGGGATRLMVTPAQHRSVSTGDAHSTARIYSRMKFRLYYSANTDTQHDSSGNAYGAALSAPPTIAHVDATSADNRVTFKANVVGNPAAGVQEVWVTWTTDDGNGSWDAVELAQSSEDSTLWTGTLENAPSSLRYVVQAVNGVGLVGTDDNGGYGYSVSAPAPPTPPAPPAETTLQLAQPASVVYGASAHLVADLSGGGAGLASRSVVFAVGGQSRTGVTDGNGHVEVDVPLSLLPGSYVASASYGGATDFAASSATQPLTVTPVATTLEVAATGAAFGGQAAATATLKAAGQPLQQRTIVFTITGDATNETVTSTTDVLGVAPLDPTALALDPGVYHVTASFGGTLTLNGKTVDLTDPAYASSTGAADVTIVKATQTIAFGAAPSPTYGDEPVSVPATATSGLDVSLTSADGPCQVASGKVVLTGAGECTVTVDQPGNARYEPAPSATTTFAIAKAPLTVTARDATNVYGAPVPTFGVTYDGLVDGDTASDLGGHLVVLTTGVFGSAVGTYPIRPSGLTSPNYAIHFEPGTLTVTKAPLTVTADDATKVYGAALPGFAATFRGFVLGDTRADLGGSLDLATPATAASDVGAYRIRPSGVTSRNYDVDFVDGTLTVTKAPLTVTADDFRIHPFDDRPAYTATIRGFVLGQDRADLGGTLAFSTTATQTSWTGDYPITPRGLTSPNYSIDFADGALTIALPQTTSPAHVEAKLQGRTVDSKTQVNVEKGRIKGKIDLERGRSDLDSERLDAVALSGGDTAEVYGVFPGGVHFRVDAFDGGRRSADRYRIRLTDGYDSAGTADARPQASIGRGD